MRLTITFPEDSALYQYVEKINTKFEFDSLARSVIYLIGKAKEADEMPVYPQIPVPQAETMVTTSRVDDIEELKKKLAPLQTSGPIKESPKINLITGLKMDIPGLKTANQIQPKPYSERDYQSGSFEEPTINLD